MINQRAKGARGERQVANKLKDIFPDAHRNWLAQTAKKHNGCDLEGTDPFNIEVKTGKIANIKKIRGWLDQVDKEGLDTRWNVVVANPDREDMYVIMPFSDWKEVLGVLKSEKII